VVRAISRGRDRNCEIPPLDSQRAVASVCLAAGQRDACEYAVYVA